MCTRQRTFGLLLSGVMVLAGAPRTSLADAPDLAPAVATPPSAAAPEAAPLAGAPGSPPPARLSFGAHLGLGELSFRFDRYSFWGPSHPVQAWLGFSLTEDLVLFGEFYDAHVFDPSSTFAAMAGLDLLGFGLGAKYYLTPAGVYLSGSLLLSRVRFDNGATPLTGGDPIDEHTHWGWSGRLALGKDWQVSRGWRLGLEGDVVFGWMDFEYAWGGPDFASSVRGFSMLGSASYGYEVPSSAGTGASSRAARRGSFTEIRAGAGHLWNRFGGDSAAGAIYPLGVSLGGLIGRRVAMLADFGYARQSRLRTASYQLDSITSYSAGPRMKYYLTPSMLFLSGALLVSRMEFEGAATSVYWGVGAELSFGKEWRVSDSWAVGLAAESLLARMGTESHGQHFAERLSLLAFANFGYQRLADESPAVIATEPKGDSVAGIPVPPDGASAGRHTHDGIYAGAHLGVGFLKVEGAFDYGSMSGWGTPFALSVGYAFARSLVIFGEFHQFRLRHPKSTGYVTDLDFTSVGPGMTYYVPGINAFASLSASLSQLGYRNGTPMDTRYGTNRTSDWGVTGRLCLGKEWWVSSDWGLGVAGEVLYGRMKDRPHLYDDEIYYTAKGVTLLASASFN